MALLSIKYGRYSISGQQFGATSINTEEELTSFIKKNQNFAYIKMNETKVNFVLADTNSAVHELRQRFSSHDALEVETTIDPENVSKVNLSGAYVPLFGRDGFFKYGLEHFTLYPTGVLVLGVDENSEIKFRQRISKWKVGYETDKYYSIQEASIKLSEFNGDYPSSFVNIIVDDNWHP
jgi:hypothetical protein